MSEEEMRRKEIEEKEQDVIKQLIEEIRQLRMAIQAHTRALYMLSSYGRSYGNSYKRSRGWKRWRKWAKR